MAAVITIAVRLLEAPTRREIGKGLARSFQHRFTTGLGLIPVDDHIDIQWVDFDATAPPASSLGGDQHGPRTKEGIEHDVAASGDVEKRVHQHSGRFDGRVVFEPLAGVGASPVTSRSNSRAFSI
jgi:hypothetical protein